MNQHKVLLVSLFVMLLLFQCVLPAFPQDSTGQTIDLDFEETDIRHILRAIAKNFDVNIVPDNDVQGTVTIHLEDVTLKQALSSLLDAHGYEYDLNDGIYRVHKEQENPYINVEDGKLTLHADNVDINEIIRSISIQGNRNITFTQSISKKITSHFNNVPLNQGLKRMVEDNNLSFTRDGDIYKITPVKPSYTVQWKNDKLTIEAERTSLKDLIRTISQKTGFNIVVNENIKKTVTISIQNSEFSTAMNALLEVYGLKMAEYRNIYRIYREKKGFELPLTLTNNKLTLDVRGVKLETVVKQIAERGGYNLVMHAPMQNKVRARFQDIDFLEGLEMLFKNTDYGYRIMGDLLVTGRKSINADESDLFLEEKKLTFEYIKPQTFIDHLPKSIPVSHVESLEKQNGVLVHGTEQMLKEAKQLSDTLDKRIPQIAIEVLAIEVNKDQGRDLGLLLASGQDNGSEITFEPSASGTNISVNYSGVAQLTEQFTANLQALERDGTVEIRARPTITTKSGRSAKINVGSEDFFRVTIPSGNSEVPLSKLEKIPSGISLNITPWTGLNSEQINVDLQAEVSSSSGRTSTNTLPTISTRTANTQLTLEEGKTLIIGGLMNNRESNTHNRTPILGDIPLLGYLFGQESISSSQSELVFYITPRLVTNGDSMDDLRNPHDATLSDTFTSS